MDLKWHEPKKIWHEYEKGTEFKNGLSDRGLYAQNKINERMYIGDQWYGARTGDKPLVRYNIIKRIGDYKLAMVAGNNVAVNYSAEGVPNTVGIKDTVKQMRNALKEASGYPIVMDISDGVSVPSAAEINLAMAALSDYHKVTAERLKLDDLKTQALRKAYISGTGLLYTYWDSTIETGLYADVGMTSPIKGDIACEVLDIENVYFGNPTLDNVQNQPYILIAHRRELDDVIREAKAHRLSTDDIKADEDTAYLAGDASENELTDSKRVTVITKFYKEWDDNGNYKIMAVKVTEKSVVRRPWDTKLRLYPIAKMSWETRSNCVYGDSEVTHLVPNQIAINRSITASVWAIMQMGMPSIVVNGDIVPDQITNDPGQIIRVYGAEQDVANAIRYVTPPNFSPQFDNIVNSLIANTQSQAGANDAALGNMRPDNTSAIIAVREAATMPLQIMQNRFYSFIEDNARIWAEYWLQMYGNRALKMDDDDGEWYLPFYSDKYKNLLISARIDVGQASLWSQIQERQTLDNLLQAGIINPQQYLERLPKGIIPNLTGLQQEYKDAVAQQQQQAQAQQAAEGGNPMDSIDPQLMAQFNGMTQEQQQRVAELLGNSNL